MQTARKTADRGRTQIIQQAAIAMQMKEHVKAELVHTFLHGIAPQPNLSFKSDKPITKISYWAISTASSRSFLSSCASFLGTFSFVTFVMLGCIPRSQGAWLLI